VIVVLFTLQHFLCLTCFACCSSARLHGIALMADLQIYALRCGEASPMTSDSRAALSFGLHEGNLRSGNNPTKRKDSMP